MRHIAATLLLLTSLILALPSRAAELTAEQWLLRMSEAANALSYQGTLVYSRGDELVNFRLTHVRDGVHEWEHLVQLDGRANEVVRGGGDLIYKSPGASSTRMQLPPATALRPDTTAAALARSRENYRFVLTAGERVAGRDAVQVAVMPLAGDRYGHVFYLDRSSSLLLKSRLLDSNGAALETLGFSTLAIGSDVGRQEYQSARRAAAVHGVTVPAPVLAVARPLPARWQLQLPAGYVAGPEGLRVRQVNGTRVEVITYGDGLSSFSVFSEKLSGKAPRTGQSQRGSTAMVSRVLVADGQSWLLTVVGELPLASVQRIADSLQLAMP